MKEILHYGIVTELMDAIVFMFERKENEQPLQAQGYEIVTMRAE
jgi:hypothetical protein